MAEASLARSLRNAEIGWACVQRCSFGLNKVLPERVMTHAQSISRAPPEARTSPRRLFAELVSLVREWHRRARSRRELAALCDRCLRDMRMTRYDIEKEVRKPFWRA